MPGKRFSARLPERSHDIMEQYKEVFGTKTQVVVHALNLLSAVEGGRAVLMNVPEADANKRAAGREEGQDDG